MSRTHQYRKVTKPLLERKRRARINKCLDEIKDILVDALQAEGESITKLEKADVLELTLKHLQKLKQQQRLVPTKRTGLDLAGSFHNGYTACVQEVSGFLNSSNEPAMGQFGSGLMHHLATSLKHIEARNQEKTMPLTVMVAAPRPQSMGVGQTLLKPVAPVSSPSITSDCGYSSGRDSVSPPISTHSASDLEDGPLDLAITNKSVWRPF